MLSEGFYLLNTFAFIVLIVLSFAFFSKKRLKQLEDESYARILIVSIIAMIFGIGSGFSLTLQGAIGDFLIKFTCKVYLSMLMADIWVFAFYTLCISKKMTKFRDFLLKYGIYIVITLFIIVLLLPVNIKINGAYFLPEGPSISFVFTLFSIIYSFLVILIIMDFKNIKSKKYIPIVLLIIQGILLVIIQIIRPELNYIINPSTVLTCLIMYFTIENPDVKMLKVVEAAKEQADKANQAKSDFLSAMSHEIRTPLNAIVGFSESLKEESLTPSQLEEVNDIIDASNTLLETVNGILDISKIEANKIEIINETYSTEKLFRELVKLSEARLGNEKPIEFKYHLAEDTPKYLYGDHVRIKQVILNFLTNAIKYTKRGYIEFDVRNICRGNTCRLIIKVEDSGIGIKKESIDRLFDKFDRLDNENSTIEGTGLGLAITKRLVELMHGRIIVQSIYGKGSQFTVVIDQRIVNDAIAQEVEEVKEESTTINNDLSSKKVLIVDDNLMNLKVAARLLKSYNVIIEQADSGFKCLDLIGAGNKYDLILLDDMMPKMSGKETFKKLKEDSSFNTPVVILTANAITGMKEEYLQFGFNDYLAKPIEKDELNRVIKKFLDK